MNKDLSLVLFCFRSFICYILTIHIHRPVQCSAFPIFYAIPNKSAARLPYSTIAAS